MSANGGPAFPVPSEYYDKGMTLRDYFAAKALPTALQKYDMHMPAHQREAAVLAYHLADAMLAARALPPTN